MTHDRYGSDLVVDTLTELGIEYAAVNPGASFRGLHESLVSSGRPELILALHENVAVAAAHGYAKSAGRPMAVVLHNLVGLQSGSMSIFNAWADQAPVLVLGGSGPVDATRRRPWIDWVHTAHAQSLVVRDSVKWDDQPASLAAVPASLRRAHRIATTVPYGPTYVALDAGLQEEPLGPSTPASPGLGPLAARPSMAAPQDVLDEVADLLVRAERPVILADYVGKSAAAYAALAELAEALAAPVVDLMARHNFPTGHWADATDAHHELLADADVVLCLDLRDLMFGLGRSDAVHHGYESLVRPSATVVSISTNQLMLKGFLDYAGTDHPAAADAMVDVLADTALCLPVLAGMVAERAGDRSARRRALTAFTADLHERSHRRFTEAADQGLTSAALSRAVRDVVSDGPWELANGQLRGDVRRGWPLDRFNAHLGRNVGAGLGYGMGVSVGAALAHRGDDTMVVNLQPDGDLLYTPSGLWTAARYRLPILTVMANNRTYGQDRMHQTIMARTRERAVENAGVGIDLDDPEVDFAMLARAQGVESWGPVTDRDDLTEVLTAAAKVVRDERRPALVDVVLPRQG
ncbi:MAG: thiamine pyrophosphate-binding protein [Streptosporangiales bacterium]|nr:thiamine pyrophosphate-binding protein [Streptosporangiales bacterium]